jgi:hypothetical protein
LLRDHAQARRRPPRIALPAAFPPGMPSAGVAGVPPQHVADALGAQHDVSAAAWRPANDATPSGIRVLGSSAGCTVAPEISARSLCEDRFATPAAGLWQGHRLRWYAERVPWEVMTPLGPPGEERSILLGHFCPKSILSLCRHRATACERLPAEGRRKNERR